MSEPPVASARPRPLRTVRARRAPALGLVAWLAVAAAVAGQDRADVPPPAPAPPGVPAPPEVLAEIRQALDDALRQFHAMHAPGVLAHVSEQYRTGPFTKRLVAEQLRAIFALHDQVTAQVRIDDVRIVGEHAWIYSTGEVIGRLRLVGGSIAILQWERELEVARREHGRWRLFGYQQ